MARYPPATIPNGAPAVHAASHSARPNAWAAYISHPGSPTYVTLRARHGTGPTAMWRARMYGKASVERSAVVSGWRMSLARGPHSPRQTRPDVTSARWTDPSSGARDRIHERSCCPNAVPVTIRKRSSARRVTVKSHSIPPRAFSIDVYTIVPGGRPTSLAHNPWRKRSAPGPDTSILANDV